MTSLIPDNILQTWSTVANSPDYQSASDDDKAKAITDYYHDFVAPTVSTANHNAAFQHFAMAVTPAKDIYTTPAFLKMPVEERKDVLRSNLIARGVDPSVVPQQTPTQDTGTGYDGITPSVPDTTSTLSTNGTSNPIQQEYDKFEADPEVAKLRHLAIERYAEAPILGLSQSVMEAGAATGKAFGMKDSVAERGLENVNARINQKNKLGEYFPGLEPLSMLTTGVALAPVGIGSAAITEAPEAATTIGNVGRWIGNTFLNSAGSTALNPEQVNPKEDQVSGTANEMLKTGLFNTGLIGATNAAVPAGKAAYDVYQSARKPAFALAGNINRAAKQLAKATGLTKDEVITNTLTDVNKANPAEATSAGISGVKSDTSATSQQLIRNVDSPQRDRVVQAQTRVDNINLQAEKNAETAGKFYATKRAAEITPINASKDLAEVTTEPTSGSGDLKAGIKTLAPDAKNIRNVTGVTAAQYLRDVPVSSYADADEIANTANFSSKSYKAGMSITGNVEGENALANSKTLQVIKEQANPKGDYQSLIDRYGPVEGQKYAKLAGVKQPAPAQLNMENLNSHINSLNDEISKLPEASDAKWALIGAKENLEKLQQTAYKTNPGLEKVVKAHNDAIGTDRAMAWFEKNIPGLEPANSIDRNTGKLAKNLNMESPESLVEKYSGVEGQALLKKETGGDLQLYKLAQKQVELAKQQARQSEYNATKGMVAEGAEVTGGKALLHQLVPGRTVTTTLGIESIKKMLNSNYTKAVDDFVANNSVAKTALRKTILKNGKDAAYKQFYQSTVRPALNTAEGVVGNANEDRNDTKNAVPTSIDIQPGANSEGKPIQGNTDHGYGQRADGSYKGNGFLGMIKRPDGKQSSELSIGVNIDGKETDIPSLVPTLTKDEINYLVGGGKPTEAIIQKAVSFAQDRKAKGLPYFATDKESPDQTSNWLKSNPNTIVKEEPLAMKGEAPASEFKYLPPKEDVKGPIQSALVKNGMDPNKAEYAARTMGVESNFGKDTEGMAKSKAEGLTQFYGAAKKEVEDRVGHPLDLNKPGDAAVAAVAYADINKERLQKGGFKAPTDADLYAAHHLGAQGFLALKKRITDQIPAASIPSMASAFKGNKSIFQDKQGRYRTPAQVIQHLHQMYNKQASAAKLYLASNNGPQEPETAEDVTKFDEEGNEIG